MKDEADSVTIYAFDEQDVSTPLASINKDDSRRSKELEVGKCGEYYAVFKILKQGFSCFLSDQGLPYDIVADVNGVLLKGQVRSTVEMRDYGKSKNVYRFSTRVGKNGLRASNVGLCDFYAFVVIGEEKVCFMHSSELLSSINPGTLVQTIEFRSSEIIYPGRMYPNGTQRFLDYSRNIEEYDDFSRIAKIVENSNG